MTAAPRDTGLQAASAFTAIAVNGLIFTGMALAGLIGTFDEPPDLPAIPVEILELPKLGTKPPEPQALPRIVAPTPPPPPKQDEVSLSREKEEAIEREKKEKEERERLAAEVRKQDEERQKQEEEDRRRREEDERRRKKAMQQALDRATDVRADDEDAPGFEKGDRAGTSLDPESLKNQLVYLKRVEIALSSQLQVPAVIPPDTLKRLKATVSFKVDAQGKVQGEPKLVSSSGNNFFDEAALTAVRKFGPGSQLRIPMPIDDDVLTRKVLHDGLKPTMDGARINR